MDETHGPDSDSDCEWLHELLCKRPRSSSSAAADPGESSELTSSEWLEELLGKKEAARAGQQPGFTGSALSGTAARRELPEEAARHSIGQICGGGPEATPQEDRPPCQRCGREPRNRHMCGSCDLMVGTGCCWSPMQGTCIQCAGNPQGIIKNFKKESEAPAGMTPVAAHCARGAPQWKPSNLHSGFTGSWASGTAARPDRLRGEQPGQTGSRRDPATIVAIREERLRREAVEQKQNAERERSATQRALKRMSGCSPDSRHSGRNKSEIVRERCSERSLSPLVLERLARQETADLPAVRWEKHLDGIDPRAESIACSARQAILGAPSFYVGVTRYPRRRWLGGDHLTFEESHSSRWETMHVLSTHSHRVGDAEDALIRILRKENGERCANIRGGGGGASPYKTNLLYVCVP